MEGSGGSTIQRKRSSSSASNFQAKEIIMIGHCALKQSVTKVRHGRDRLCPCPPPPRLL